MRYSSGGLYDSLCSVYRINLRWYFRHHIRKKHTGQSHLGRRNVHGVIFSWLVCLIPDRVGLWFGSFGNFAGSWDYQAASDCTSNLHDLFGLQF